MNAGYFKLSKYIGMKCHNDLTMFFSGRLIRWSYRAARIVSELYKKDGEKFCIRFSRKKYTVIDTDKRKRIKIRHNGEFDQLSAQADQIIERNGEKYILDYKFTKLPKEEAEQIVFDARQQIAYYAWIINDPKIRGGAVIVSNVTTDEVVKMEMFDFEKNEKERALIRRLNELPGYENLKYEEIERV